MNPLTERSAGRDDRGRLVPHLTPDSRGRVGVGVGGPAREVVQGDSGVDVDVGGTIGEVPEGSGIGCSGALELEPGAVPLIVDRRGGPVVQPTEARDLDGCLN
jgi:hypothetical protein